MRVKMPTMTDPQDPKDAPHSHNGGGSGFLPYVSAWEWLPDAIERVTAGGRSKELAQADLCRAIAEGTVRIQGKLMRLMSSRTTSKAVLEGTDFQIPTEIKPEAVDWERSCPLKSWIVRRGRFSPSGHWFLEWIKVCRDDVTRVLCAANEQDETTRVASGETPSTSAGRPVLESQEMPVGPGQRSTAGPETPSAGPARRRGARPLKFEKARDAMRDDLQQGRLPVAQLASMLEKNLAATYGVSRDTARKAREAVLSELNSRQTPTIDK